MMLLARGDINLEPHHFRDLYRRGPDTARATPDQHPLLVRSRVCRVTG